VLVELWTTPCALRARCAVPHVLLWHGGMAWGHGMGAWHGGMAWGHGGMGARGGGREEGAHSGCSALKFSLIFLAASTYTARSVAGSAFQFTPSSTDTAALVLGAEERERIMISLGGCGAGASSKGCSGRRGEPLSKAVQLVTCAAHMSGLAIAIFGPALRVWSSEL
jgi:hypothetical protein